MILQIREEIPMKNRIKHLLSVLVLAFLVSPATSWAQEKTDDDAQAPDKKEEKNEKKSVVDNEIKVGIYYLSDDSFRFGKYSGLTNEGAYALVDFRWEKRPEWDSGDAIRWRLQGWRVGLNSRRIEFDWSQQGKQRFKFDYRQIPNNKFENGLTPYMGLGGGELRMPEGWEIAPGSSNTRGFVNLDQYLRPYDIKTDRKSMTLNYDLKISSNWDMAIDYRHENMDGVRNTWGIFGHNMTGSRSVEIPAPVDWNTDNFSLMFNYANGRAQFGAGVYASFFNNDTSSLSWQNAYGRAGNWEKDVTFPDSFGQMALEPDNQYLQFKAYGGFIFNAKTRLTADFSWGAMKQDDAFYPYTINPDLRVRDDLPRSDADAKINTTLFSVRLTSRLARRLNLVANYRYDDRDNKTPQAAYRYVGGDSENQKPTVESRINLPYSYTRNKADVLLNWNVARGASIKGGVEWNDYSRTWSEVEDSNEWAWLAGARYSSMHNISTSLDYRHSNRNIDEYIGNVPFQESHLPGVLPPDAWQNHPWQRKYNLTDRDRDEWRFRLDWFPVSEFNIGVTGSSWKDDYDAGAFGLNRAKANSWTLDFGYHPADKVFLSAFYTRENWKADQSSRQFFSSDPNTAWTESRDWWADTRDQVDTMNFHAGFNDLGKSENFTFGFDYTYSSVESRIDVTGAERVETAPLPALKNKLRSFVIYGQMEINERSAVMLRAESSKLTVDDFALDNVTQDTLAHVLTLGQPTQGYDLWLISASWSYRF
jgi:MtrB/PioB family decaheme-associated outer membrane protein